PVADRHERLARVHQLAWQAMDRCEPGSDRQLTALRLVVRSSPDADRLRRWYRGDQLPVGVELDPEVRWEIVERAATMMEDHGLISDALDRDSSAAAQIHAARARAALASGEVKERAWRLLMHPSAAAAYEVYATAEGFFQTNQSTLTAPFVPRYFADIGETALFRSGWALSEVANRAFPWTFPTTATLALAQQALAGDLAPPLRRALVDGTDRLRRAVRSLGVFGEPAPSGSE
ncbi:MAG: pepN, partial [Propionibacteriaceae bacterium]|nr:pepN [Propionibacteriaceae bacterium]